MEATVFNIQRFSVHDGPGVRTVVFLKGCPLDCLWCHNPESKCSQPQIMFNPDRCCGCGGCAQVCACHRMEQGLHSYDRTQCVRCGRCVEECFSLALTKVGQTMTVEEVLQEVNKDRLHYEATGGGLTVSGGEPLLHRQFTVALLKAAREQGLHTCVETSGFGPGIRELAPYTDLFLFDYKATGESLHRQLCGVPQAPILENLALLQQLDARVILRCPLIPELNCSPDHLKAIGELANTYSCLQQIHLLPYHRLGISKAKQLGITGGYENTPPARQTVEEYAAVIEQHLRRSIPVSIQ